MSGANLDRAVGRILGERYQLVSLIGSGASAEVYQATDLRLGRNVAVKQLKSSLTDDLRFAKLFRNEAHLAAKLSHPNILTVFDWSADADGQDGGAYIVTELLTGGTLRSVLDVEETVSLSQAAFIGLQAARGLAVAHESGLVHRDIKPANLLFGSDGRIHIGDFGIARAVAQAAWTEPEGVLIGTARYAAPEQATTGAIDGLVDVYSLTICIMEALTGEVPLVQETAIGTMVIRQAEDLPVDESFGVLAEPLAWGGLADPLERATAAEFRDSLLTVCRTLPDPDPLILIDLTEHTGGPVSVGRVLEPPNVHITDDGELIIEGDDSDLAIPAPEEPLEEREESSVLGHLLDDDEQWDQERVGPGSGGGDGGPEEIRASPRRLRWLIGLTVGVLLLAGAGIGGRLLAQSRQLEVETISLGLPTYPVSDFSGLTADEVALEVEPNSWSLTVSEEYVDGTVPGQLLSQAPEAGTLLPPGGGISLVYSLGPKLRVVPQMVGLDETEVRAAIEDVNLTVGSIAEQSNEDVEVGIVLEATIDGVPAQPGSEFLTGTTVDLLISSGPAPREVPQLAGLSVEQARIALEDKDLLLTVTEQFSDSVPEGLIIGNDPGAGASIPRGATVTVSVSLGVPFVEVPDLVGRPVSEAIVDLRAQGFTVVINGAVGETVIATRPGAGESVRTGSSIEVISDE